jgi:3-phosphoshikimate 1-carboxyvinyltransferase
VEGGLPVVEVEGHGRSTLARPAGDLDCGNSGTTMRLLAGVLAAAPFRTVLTGDASLTHRPMERVAAPLRAMGADLSTVEGHPPITIEGGSLHGIRYELPMASAQVKSAVILAGVAAEGETTVVERAATRDHTERALTALGAPIRTDGRSITVSRFEHAGFTGRVPGDPSSAAFLIAAAALAGSTVRIVDVGVNPTRTRYLAVMRRMGLPVSLEVEREEVGEPVGSIVVEPAASLAPVRVEPDELPEVIDEVPVLAALAAHATGPSWFAGAGELRIKESDRLGGLAEGFRALGQHAAVEGDDLVVVGGGVGGGRVSARGDHRMAMAFAVTALRADGPVEVDGIEASAVSFPGFVPTLRAMGFTVEEVGP